MSWSVTPCDLYLSVHGMPRQSLGALHAVRPTEMMRGIGPQLYSLMPRRMWASTAHQALSRNRPLAHIEHDTLRAAVAGVLGGVGEELFFTKAE